MNEEQKSDQVELSLGEWTYHGVLSEGWTTPVHEWVDHTGEHRYYEVKEKATPYVIGGLYSVHHQGTSMILKGRNAPRYIKKADIDESLLVSLRERTRAAFLLLENKRVEKKAKDENLDMSALLPYRKAYVNARSSLRREALLVRVMHAIMTGAGLDE